jgi:hypothetical protein
MKIGPATLAPPTNLTAIGTSTSEITLNWSDNSNNETGFQVEARVSANPSVFQQITQTGAGVTSFLHGGRAPSTTTVYRVRAVGTTGVSAYSNEATGTSQGPPAAPSNLTAKATDSNTVDVRWTDNSPNEDGFRLERKVGSGSFVEIRQLGANLTQALEQAVAAETTFTYRVRAVNAFGVSSFSNSAAVTTLNAPVNVQANGLDTNTIQLSWLDNSAFNTGFRIDRKKDGGSFTTLKSVGATTLSTTDTQLQPNSFYLYKIVAIIGSNSASSASMPSPVVRSLATPTQCVAFANSSAQVRINWLDTTTGEENYLLERRIGNGSFVLIATLGPGTTQAFDAPGGDLLFEIAYSYRVRAKTSNSLSSFSNIGTTFPLEQPGQLTATLITATRIKLTWGDTNNIETGTLIQRIVGTEGVFVDHATVGANVVTFTDINLQPDKLHTYRVRAISAVAASSLGNNAAATTGRIPVAPTDLSAHAESGTSIRLRWKDNSQFETEFRIERRDDLSEFAEIAQTPKNGTEFLDTGLVSGATYTYRVRASHEGGASPYSNEASATTSRGKLEVSVRSLDFGFVPVGQSKTLSFKVRNRSGRESLHVSVSDVSGPFAVDGPQSLLLPPSRARTLSVRFSPTRRGAARGRLLLQSSDPKDERVSVKLRGRGL